jgi:WD40 repeat protein
VGSSVGSLYLIDGANPPVLVDDVEFLSCLGHGTFQFAPNGSRFGYIDYVSSITGLEFATGVLKINDALSLSEAARFENVTAFDLDDNQALFVSLFANNRSEADEAAVSLWDGTATREIATLIPTGERCRFTSATIASAPNGGAALVMGQRCMRGNTATQWQFYTLDLQARSATLVSSNFQPGSFVPYAGTNNLFFSPDGAFTFFTVPDGVTTSTVALAAVDSSSMNISVPIHSQAVFPAYSAAANALPRLSPDGRWLAMVVTSPNNDNQLVALDLTQPNVPPITISAGSRGDLISGMAFTPNSEQIIYVAGDTNGGDSTLLVLNLTVGSEQRLARGHFGADLVVSPDGTAVALLDWKRVETPREPMYADLVRIDLATQAITTLLPGAQIVDGRVTQLQTIIPLEWR